MKIISFFALILTLCIATLGHASEYDPKAYEKLLRNDAAFAAAEKTYKEARAAFLTAFDKGARPYAEKFLQSINYESEYEYLEAHPGGQFRTRFVTARAFSLEYLAAFNAAKPMSLQWLTLLRPVFAHCPYLSDKKDFYARAALVEAQTGKAASPVEAAPNQARNLAERPPLLREVNGETWGAVLSTGEDMQNLPKKPEPGRESPVLAATIRLRNGKITADRIAAPTAADWYPSKGEPVLSMHPPMVDSRRNTFQTGLLIVRATVANDSGPFAFTVEPVQRWRPAAYAYICRAEAKSFSFTWNGKVYERAKPELRPTGEWGAFTPLTEKGALKPVVEYLTGMLLENPDLSAAIATEKNTRAALLEQFTPTARMYYGMTRGRWTGSLQWTLLPLVGDKKAFTRKILDDYTIATQYNAMLQKLLQTPDARLLFALEPATTAPRDRLPSLRYAGSLSSNDYIAELARVTRIIENSEFTPAFVPKQPRSEAPVPLDLKAEGLKGGAKIALCAKRASGEAYDEWADYSLEKQADGTHWGLMSYETESRFRKPYYTEKNIVIIRGGKLDFIPLEVTKPVLSFFFRDWKGWAKNSDKPENYWKTCPMETYFDVDTRKAPFTVRAEWRPSNTESRDYWVCVPECSVPYAWDGKTYAPGEPDCLPPGKWGLFEPKR